MNDKPSYMGWLPAEVRYDADLIPNAKLLYTEITALSNKQGFCWATNNYFSELYGVSDRSIQRWIKSLADKHYILIEIVYREGGKEVEQRKIYINKTAIGMSRNVTTPHDKNVTTPHDKNVVDNNTSINNTSINIKKNNKKKVTPPTLEEIQEYIAEKNYEVDAQTFFDYYDSADWHDAKGNPVKSWKQRLATWNSRKEKNGSVRTDFSRQKGTFDESYVTGDTSDTCPW